MNTAQRLYDSGFNTITGAQQLNPFKYYSVLKLINQRRTQYPSFGKINIKRVNKIPYQDFFVIESNKKYKKKIRDMREKPVIPKINTLYLELDQRIKNNKSKIVNNKIRALTLENVKYNKRVRNQKPKLLKAEFLQKLFIENHDKYLELLLRNTRFRKKVGNSQDMKTPYVKLPNLSEYKGGLYKKHYRTEYNLDENSDSNNNSVEQKDHKHKEISHKKGGHYDKQNY